MKIIKNVLIKQIITENSRDHLIEQFQKQKLQLEQECQQLLFEKRKLKNKPGISKQEVSRRFDKEINKRKEKITLIDFKLKQMDILELGVEIIEDEVEALVEVREGMSWAELTKEQAIILKDGIVVRIDE